MRAIPFFALSILLFSPSLSAGDIVRSPHTEAELIAEENSIQSGRDFYAALRLKMDSHWHTYWRNAGDSGIPTRIEWQLPEGYKAGEIEWPYPTRYDMPPLTVYGYTGEVFLLTRISPPANLNIGSPETLRMRAAWLECEEICIPGKGEFEMTLPVSAEVPAVNKERVKSFAQARSLQPLHMTDLPVEAQGNQAHFLLTLHLNNLTRARYKDVYFFPEEGNLVDHAADQIVRQEDDQIKILIPRSGLLKGVPEILEGVLYAENGWRGPGSEKALAITANVQAVDTVLSLKPEKSLTALWALLFAFTGGMILNLMPCVFPILSLKVTHFVEQASHHPHKVWLHGLAFTAGVVVSFWILAATLIVLKAGGHQIGWGFQLQSPVFLILLLSVFWLLALNLFGLYEIGVTLTRAGNYSVHKHGLPGAFLSGILATVVATPCTAPFMGAALGFALTQPLAVALGVFSALGLGMALPYLVLSFFPRLLGALPQPGSWMITLKKIMGLLLTATVAWLVWILFLQTGFKTVFSLGMSLLLLLGSAYLYGKVFQRGDKKPSVQIFLLLIAAGLVAVAGPISVSRFEYGHDLYKQHKLYDLDWKNFSPEMIEELRGQNRPIFLDFTAAWCLSCQVNERLVFGSKKVREAIKKIDLVLVKADWTHHDPEITQALAQFGRSSIPFYVLYLPGEEPAVLPEILTPQIMLKKLREKYSEIEL